MSEQVKEKRVVFPKGHQRRILIKLEEQMTLNQMANICHLSERTLRDWKREKFLASAYCLKRLCKIKGINFPNNAKFKSKYWYTHEGGKRGGRAVLKKYGRIGGDVNHVRQKWYEWWEREGKYKQHPFFKSISIKKPRLSAVLAEFCGIILGDGSITDRQVTVTLHQVDDREYTKHVRKLFKELFDINVSIYARERDSTNNIVASRTELVKYCTETLGLKKGNKIKQQIDIPGWIKNNKKFRIACLRGLVDTDGSVFTHRYISNNKKYCYKKMSFTSRSSLLLNSASDIFKEIGLHARINNREDVRVESIDDVNKYFNVVGSNNPKHLKRYKT